MLGGVEQLLKSLVAPFRRFVGGSDNETESAERGRNHKLNSEETEMAENAETQVEAVAEVPEGDTPVEAQEVVAEVVVAAETVVAEAPAMDEAAPATATQVGTKAVKAEDPPQDGEVTEAFADLYAASSQAFANSRAMKAQKEMELEALEKALPDAQRAKVEAIKSGTDMIAQAQERAAALRQEAESEVERIRYAIATKQVEIEKAETSDVEKAEALVAILTSYISRRSG